MMFKIRQMYGSLRGLLVFPFLFSHFIILGYPDCLLHLAVNNTPSRSVVVESLQFSDRKFSSPPLELQG